jgi:hypothetical protein
VTPPSCSADGSCDATADCQAAAEAQGSASLECTPPTLTFRYDFQADVDGEARAAFVAKMAALKVHMLGIVQGLFKMRALFEPGYSAELGIDPPLVLITGQIHALVDAGVGSFDIAPGRIDCLLAALEDAAELLAELAVGLGDTFAAQLEIVLVLDVL